MANLVSIREVSDGRDGGIVIKDLNREYTRAFVLEFDSGLSGPDEVLTTAGIPSVMDVYQSAGGSVDYGSYCASVAARQLDAPWIWRVEAKYSGDVDLSNPTGDPLLAPAVFKWGQKSATKPVEYAYGQPVSPQAAAALVAQAQANLDAAQAALNAASTAGNDWYALVGPQPPGAPTEAQIQANYEAAVAAADSASVALGDAKSKANVWAQVAVLNSAGDPYNPPLADEDCWLTLSISKTLPDYDPVKMLGFFNRVNDDAWLGFAPGMVLCKGITASSRYEKGQTYWECSGEFEIKENTGQNQGDAWAYYVQDHGFQAYYPGPVPLPPTGGAPSGPSGVAQILFPTLGLTLQPGQPPPPRLKRPACDLAGKVLPSGTLLDGQGNPLPPGADPVFQCFYVKKLAKFAALPLP